MTSDQHTSAHLRFSTEILRRLGEELNPTLDKGVLELVKNSYDADATGCRVELHHTDQPGGKIIVSDDGDGMTAQEIADGWLVLGRSSKVLTKPTRRGRIPAGSKGLGRLAALRMGRTALLDTCSRHQPDRRHRLLINWERFDAAKVVDDVVLGITTHVNDGGTAPGTTIIVGDLDDGFGRVPVKRLARELILLADPFRDNPEGFHPELVTSAYEDLEALVKNQYFTDAEYHLRAQVGPDGTASADVFDWKGQLLYRGNHGDLSPRNRTGPYRCPQARFNLWAFILTQEVFSLRRSTIAEVRDWLSEFGGVHFYYNGLRVSPYGGPDNDWLAMNLRRVQSPEERPGTNTSIGRIDVLDESNTLVQKTDRSGFIEADSFRELRAFAHDSLEWMATSRLRTAELRRRIARAEAPQRSTTAKARIDEAITAAPRKVRADIKKAFGSYESSRDREIELLKKEVQLYRTLSTAGITAATFAHESSANPVKIISQSVAAVERRVKAHVSADHLSQFQRPIDGIKRALKSLTVLGTAILKLLDHEKRRPSRVNLHEVIDEVLLTFAPFFAGRDVEIVKSFAPGSPFLLGHHASVESIVTNLINNSITAFEEAATRHRVIDITTTVQNLLWSLTLEDSGPGITGIRKSEIWLPGRTTRRNGTGLGLTIVRDAVQDLGGEVAALENGPLGGAAIIIRLPILGMGE